MESYWINKIIQNREISRRTGLARNTVKKYLRAGDEEPRYAKRASSSKLDPYADKLSTWLLIEATKSRKQRRTLLHTVHALNELRIFARFVANLQRGDVRLGCGRRNG